LQRYRSNLQNEHEGESDNADEDHVIVYQTLGEASLAVPMEVNDNSGESATTPDSVPSTPVDEYMPVIGPAVVESPSTPIDAALPESQPEEVQQENVPPVTNFAFKETVPTDMYKSTVPAVSKIQPRTGHKRSNSALTESVTTSNLPMRKTRRPA
jgi:hypothetical protein